MFARDFHFSKMKVVDSHKITLKNVISYLSSYFEWDDKNNLYVHEIKHKNGWKKVS